MQGTLAEAQRWASASGFSVEDPAEPDRGEYEQAVFARIVALANPTAASLALLDRLIEDAERRTQFGRVIELLVVRAVTAHRCREGEQARQSLCRALVYAQHEGFVQVFLNEGREMQLLLRELARDRTALEAPTRAYVLNLLTRFPGDSAAAEAGKTLAEPLTSRQLEILLLLAEGQSNREIATQL